MKVHRVGIATNFHIVFLSRGYIQSYKVEIDW
jgi:hypothetical protein